MQCEIKGERVGGWVGEVEGAGGCRVQSGDGVGPKCQATGRRLG